MNDRSARRFIAVLPLALLCCSAAAEAAVRVEFPAQGPGIPAYARIENPPRIIHDDMWAAIAFYRMPECVPKDFNLLSFFDAPRAFTCPLTVRGFEIWNNGVPIQVESRGLGAVPIWFVKWEELQAAVSDGVLTIKDLWEMPSLRVGYATFFHETLHPLGTANNGLLEMEGHGLLAEGSAFQLHATSVEGRPDLFVSVKISFR